MSEFLLPDEEGRMQRNALSAAPSVPEPSSGFLLPGELPASERADITLRGALKVNPDKAAEARRLAGLTDTPEPVVERNFDAVKREAQRRQIQQDMRFDPVLARQLTDPAFAKIAHDDTGNLSLVGKITSSFKRGLASTQRGGEAQAVQDSAGILNLVDRIERGELADDAAILQASPLGSVFMGAGRTPENLARTRAYHEQRMADSAVGFIRRGQEVAALPADEDLQRFQASKTFGQAINRFTDAPSSITAQVMAESTGALLPSLPLIVGGGVVGGVRGLAYTVGSTSAGTEYVNALSGILDEMGVNVRDPAAIKRAMASPEFAQRNRQAMVKAGVIGAVDAATAGMAGVRLAAGPAKNIAAQMGVQAAGGGTGEALGSAASGQEVNPAAVLSEMIAEIPGAAVDVSLMTLNRMRERQAVAATAKQDAAALQQLTEVAKASKVRARDPESFREFVENAAEGGITHVYVDTATLEQAGVTLDQLAADAPSVAEQIEQALEAGGDLRIPIGEYAAHIAGQPYADALLPHLRTDPAAPSVTEVQTFEQEEAKAFEAEVSRVVAEQEATQRVQQAAQAVEAVLMQQLTQAGRFTDDVNSAYAKLGANFYTTMAQRLGLAPQEMQQRYPLEVRAEAVPGAQIFGQVPAALTQQPTLLTRVMRQVFGQPPTESSIPKPVNKRGQIAFGVTGDLTLTPSVLTLLQNADLSTFIHESGHFYLEVLADVASRPDAPKQLQDDMQAVLQWFGVHDLATWRSMPLEQKRPHHEQFARGFEAYLFEGQAPSLQMQGLFARFRSWMVNVYRSLKSLNVELSDEVRGVMDRLLATDEQIGVAEASRSYAPLFESAERTGMTPEQWGEYQALGHDATREAVGNLERRSLRDMQWLTNAKGRKLKELQRQAEAKRAEVRAEVEAEVMATPVYRVRELVANGTLRDTTDADLNSRQARLLTALGMSGTKLSLPVLKEMYGEGPAAPWRYLSTGTNGLAATEGVDPDVYAELFGFTSGDEVVRALLDAPPPDQVIEGMTDQRMLERYGDLSDPTALQRGAEAAITNDVRARFLEREVNALSDATGQRRPQLTAARQFAEVTVARTKVRDLRPSQYSVAEAKAARATVAAWKKGDTAKAAQHKRAQLLSNQLHRAAARAVDEVDASVRYLKKFDNEGTRKNLRGEFLEQLDTLLERFDLRTSLTRRQIDAERMPLADWVRAESERLAAVQPDIPAALLNETYRKHFRDLPVEEFRGLVDAVKQLERLARREQQAYLEIRGMSFADEEARIVAEMRQHNPAAFGMDGEPKGVQPDYVPSIKRGLARAGDKLQAEFLNVETLINLMSGGQVGQAHESLFGRLSTRADWKAEKLKELYAYFKPLFAQYSIKERLAFSQRGIYVPEIGRSLTRENMVVVALHYGNAEGRQRLLQGHGWTDAQVQRVVANLDAKDWRLVDAIWRMFDENLWPELQALNERTRGTAPPKVEPLPFQTPHGQARGGYFRIKYDADLSERAHRFDEAGAVQDMLGGSMGMPRTNQGSSTQRVQEVKRAMRLDLGVMSETINETVHDLAFREAVADTWRLLNSARLQNAIKTAGGTEVYRAIVQRLRETAAPPRNPTGFIERTLSVARKNTLVVAMGLSVKTALVNVTGIIPAMARVNAGALLRNIGRFYSPQMAEHYRFILDRSDYMRNRHDSYERDLQDAVKKFSAAGSLLPEYAGWFALITYVDKGTSSPTWLAAYEEAMKRHANDEAQAVQYADHIVRQTHGSGRIVDLANIQSGHGGWGQLKKAFTMFYGYFGAQLGMLVRSGKINAQAAKAGDPYAVARLAADFTLIVVMPAVLAEIASGRCDKADDAAGWGKCIGRSVAMYASGFVPIWRDFASFTWSLFDKDVHNFGFRITPLESFFEGLGKGIKSTADVAAGEGDQTDAKNIILGVSYLLGLPGYQVWRTISGIEAVADDDAGMQAVLLGPPKR